MEMNQSIDLTAEQRVTVQALLAQHLPNTEAWVYGSRVKWTSHPSSDLDMVVFATPEQKLAVADLREAFEESNLPFRVDLFIWDELPVSHQTLIEGEHSVLIAENCRTITNRNDGVTHTKLGNCVDLIRDTVHPSDIPGIPYIGLEHIGEGSLHLLNHGTSKNVKSAKRKFKTGDTLFGALRPYFRKVIRAPFDGICSTDIWVIRSKSEVNQEYIKYLLASEKFIEYVNSRSEGTRMPRAKWQIASDFDIELPLLSEQRAIAHILGSLDDKIELNQKMNQTLEAMAKAIFKDWFVDFGPVKAKIEGRSTGLSKEFEDLFPDSFVQSEIGIIPKGWSLYSVNELAECHRHSLVPYKQPDTEFEYYSYPAYSAGEFPLLEVGSSIKSNKYILPQGSVLLGKLDPTKNKVWIPNDSENNKPQIASTEFLPFVPINGTGRALIYLLFTSEKFRTVFKGMVTGTSHQRVPLDAIQRITCIAGQTSLFEIFEKICCPWLKKMVRNRREISRLGSLRDALLPKLISDEIRLQSTENSLEINLIDRSR